MTLIAKAKPPPVKQERGLAAAWKAKAKALAVEVRNWERSYDRLERTLARLGNMKMMRRPGPSLRHPEEVGMLCAAAVLKGYFVTPLDMQDAYSAYCEEHWAAGWLSVSDHDMADRAVDVLVDHEYLTEA